MLLLGGTVGVVGQSWLCPLSQESSFPSSAAEEVHFGTGKCWFGEPRVHHRWHTVPVMHLTWVVFGDKNNGSRRRAELRKILFLLVDSSSVSPGVPKHPGDAEEAPGAARRAGFLSLAVSLRGFTLFIFCSWSAAGTGVLRLQTPWVVQFLWQHSPVFCWVDDTVDVGLSWQEQDSYRVTVCCREIGAFLVILPPIALGHLSQCRQKLERGFGPNPALSALSHVRAVNMDNSTVSFGCPLLGECWCTSNSLAEVLRLFLTCFSVLRRVLSLCLSDAEELAHKVFFLAVTCVGLL